MEPKATIKWEFEYDNHVGLFGDISEWWMVSDGAHSFKVTDEETAAELCAFLSEWAGKAVTASNTRERFEAWANSLGWNIDQNDEGDYSSDSTNTAWCGWSAGAEEKKMAGAQAGEAGFSEDRTAAQREAAFKADFKALLDKHSAEVTLEVNADPLYGRPTGVCWVWMRGKYAEDGEVIEPRAVLSLVESKGAA